MAESGLCFLQLEVLTSANALYSRVPSISLNKTCKVRPSSSSSSISRARAFRRVCIGVDEKHRRHLQPIMFHVYNQFSKAADMSSALHPLFSMTPSSLPSPSSPLLSSSRPSSSSSLPPPLSSLRHPWTLSGARLRIDNGNGAYPSFGEWEVSEPLEGMNSGRELMSHNALIHFLRKCNGQMPLAMKKGLIVLIAVTVFLASPSITFIHGSFDVSDGVALAQQTSQIRQLALLLERLAEGTASSKLLDRVVTVISGQTVVTPETVEQLKSVFEGEKDLTDLQADLANNSQDLWSSVIDTLSNMDPLSLIDSAGTQIQALFEVAAERFAAFELSTLVALGERWLLWTPFVMIPMLWQMSRNSEKDVDSDPRKAEASVEVSAELQAKALRVKEELERIELKSSLLDMISVLGKLAWESSNSDQGQTRKDISKILERLQELNPAGSTTTSSIYNDSSSIMLDVHGDWKLIYASEATEESRSQQLPAFPSLDFLGVEVSDRRQRIWRKPSKVSVPTSDGEDEAGEPMMAKNMAKVRLGPLGVVEVSVEGTWKNLKNGKGSSAFVSFQTLSARPVEIFGSNLREDLPPLGVSIPSTLQTSGQWETVYLDNSLRINKGSTGRIFLFQKML